MPTTDLEMLRGTLDVLILRTLGWGPAHGYTVARWIEGVTDDALRIEEGSLYPALHRLERRGWLESEWGLSENNRRARYYRLTPQGQEGLKSEARTWERFARAVHQVLDGTRAPEWAEGR